MYELCTYIGRLGKAPELRYTPTGTPVANFDIAVDKTWTTDGTKHDKTKWVRCATWNKTAETCAQHLDQGSLVLVTGSIEASPYIDKEGNAKATLTLTVGTIKFLPSKGGVGGTPTDQPAQDSIREEEIPF